MISASSTFREFNSNWWFAGLPFQLKCARIYYYNIVHSDPLLNDQILYLPILMRQEENAIMNQLVLFVQRIINLRVPVEFPEGTYMQSSP